MKEEQIYKTVAEREKELLEAVQKLLPYHDRENNEIGIYRCYFMLGANWADNHPCKYPFITLLDKACRYIRQYMGDGFSDEDMEDFCREMSK